MSDEAGVLDLIGRTSTLFGDDIDVLSDDLSSLVKGSRFLVIGGAGSIGQAVTKEIFKRSPKVLHVVDISENNMVELVREIRSTLDMVLEIFKLLQLIVEVRNLKLLLMIKIHMIIFLICQLSNM